MESSLTAPFDGRVREVLVRPNVQVGAQTPIVQLEPLEGGEERDSSPRVSFAGDAESPAERPERCRENLRRLEWLVLGYDVEAGKAGAWRPSSTPPART